MSVQSLVVTGALDISTDPGCSEAMDPDTALSCSLGPDIAMSLSGSTGHSDMDVSGPRTPTHLRWLFDPGLLHGARWQPEGATYVSLDPDLYKAMDPHMALDDSMTPDDTLAPGGSRGHPYLHSPCCVVAH